MVKDFFSELGLEFTESELAILKREAGNFKKDLEEAIRKSRISADVFIGGSLAKETMLKKDVNDVDIFIRFDDKYAEDNLSDLLSRIVRNLKTSEKALKIHGSRDYFRLKKQNALFEIVPVLKIKNPKDAMNVTDLSYFHVNYVRKATNKRGIFKREIIKAKAFCRALNVYGAESYIRGFSGYGLECMIINYKSFDNLARSMVRAKEKIILDPEKLYKGKDEILIELNESKLKGPVVLIDPTWKERNVLAALSEESFGIFLDALKKFIKHPSSSFFQYSEKDKKSMLEFAKKKRAQFLEIAMETEKQEGDIAGTKLKKFYRLLLEEIEKEFDVIKSDFNYEGRKNALMDIAGMPKKEVIKEGPMLSMKDSLTRFKKRHAKTFIKGDRIYARVSTSKNLGEFIKKYKVRYKSKIREMDVNRINIKNSKDFRIKR